MMTFNLVISVPLQALLYNITNWKKNNLTNVSEAREIFRYVMRGDVNYFRMICFCSVFHY